MTYNPESPIVVPSEDIRAAIIHVLSKLGANERESAPMLRRLAQNPQVHTAVRSRAAWGLQQLG